MTTTIQISTELAQKLNKLKRKSETYEDVIERILKREKTNMLLMERAIKYGNSDLAIHKEWENLDRDDKLNKEWVWENEKSNTKKK